jgi:hypothetical protein
MAVGSFRLPSGGASLIVDFSVNDATPDTNQTVTFTDLTVGATSWVWNFGDGTGSILSSPIHIFDSAGTFTVRMIAQQFADTLVSLCCLELCHLEAVAAQYQCHGQQ